MVSNNYSFKELQIWYIQEKESGLRPVGCYIIDKYSPFENIRTIEWDPVENYIIM